LKKKYSHFDILKFNLLYFQPVVGMNTSIVFTCPGQNSIEGLEAKIWTAPNGHGQDLKLEQIGPEQFRFSIGPKHSGLHSVEIDANEKGPPEGLVERKPYIF
jgi:hypothetical protein